MLGFIILWSASLAIGDDTDAVVSKMMDWRFRHLLLHVQRISLVPWVI